MRGATGFLVGIIGLCLFAAVSVLIPFAMRRSEGMLVFIVALVAAFVFLNITIVGFFRALHHLHETVLFPDDPYQHPLRGRVLFFVGYIGLLVTLVFVIFLAVIPELTRWRIINPRSLEVLLMFAWFIGWAFLGCLLGGILMMLGDIYRKAFYRTMVNPPDLGQDDDYDITRREPRRTPRRDSSDRSNRWDDD